MKANFNGISVEGTPKEIAEFKELMNKKAEPLIPHDYPYPSWWGIYPLHQSGSAVATPEWLKTQVIFRT